MHQEENIIELQKQAFSWQQTCFPRFPEFPKATLPLRWRCSSVCAELGSSSASLPRALPAPGSTPGSGAAGYGLELNPTGTGADDHQNAATWPGGLASEVEEVVTANISSCQGPCM